MLAQYRRGRDAGVLLLIDYPTPQLAELHAHHLETAIAETVNMAGMKSESTGARRSMVNGAKWAAVLPTLIAGGRNQRERWWSRATPSGFTSPSDGSFVRL